MNIIRKSKRNRRRYHQRNATTKIVKAVAVAVGYPIQVTAVAWPISASHQAANATHAAVSQKRTDVKRTFKARRVRLKSCIDRWLLPADRFTFHSSQL
jgi:hypothetical protein